MVLMELCVAATSDEEDVVLCRERSWSVEVLFGEHRADSDCCRRPGHSPVLNHIIREHQITQLHKQAHIHTRTHALCDVHLVHGV